MEAKRGQNRGSSDFDTSNCDATLTLSVSRNF